MTQSTSGGSAPRLASNTETLGELSQGSPQAKERLVGAWKLVSCVGRWSDGRVTHPYGPNPAGLMVYSADGNFSGQLHSRARPLFQSGNLLKGEPEEIKAAFEGYVAYYGAYEVDEAEGRLTHHVEGSLFPNWAGEDQIRLYQFVEGRLSLTTPPFVGKRAQLTLTLLWERGD